MANIKEAFQYAAQNPNSDFANNLKKLAASGSLDQEAKKYNIDLSPFKPKEEEPGILSKIGTDLGNRYNEAKQGLGMVTSGYNKANFQGPGLQDNSVAGMETATGVGKIGNAILGGVSDVINEPIKAGLDAIGVSGGISNGAKSGFEALPKDWQDTAKSLFGSGVSAYNTIAPEGSPQREAANMLGNATNIVGAVEGAGEVKKLAKGAVNTAKGSTESALKLFTDTAPVAQKLGLTPDIAGKVVKSYVANASGVSPISQDFIINTAKSGKFDQLFSPEVLAQPRQAEMQTLQDVASKLDGVVGDKGVIGKQYSDILAQAKPFKFSRQSLVNDVVDSTKLKYDLKKGFYKTPDTVNITDADLNKLNSLVSTYKGVKELSPDQFKVLRETIGGLAYDNGIKTQSGQYIANKLYQALNNTYRKNIPGLAELDNKFSDAIDNINEVKNYFTKDTQGNLVLKDNAERQLSSLLERGNERKLETIKQFVPDAVDKIAYANTLRNLDVAQGNLIGNYGKTGGNIMAGMAGSVIGGPVGGVAAFLANLYASNPTNVAKAIGKIYRPALEESSSIIKNAPSIPKNSINDISATIPQVVKKASNEKTK